MATTGYLPLVEVDEAAGTTTFYVGGTEYSCNNSSGVVTPMRHYSLDGGAVAVRTVAGGLKHMGAAPQGTIHLDAREYDPRLGKFTTVDPIIDPGNPKQLNAYALG